MPAPFLASVCIPIAAAVEGEDVTVNETRDLRVCSMILHLIFGPFTFTPRPRTVLCLAPAAFTSTVWNCTGSVV